MMQHVIPKSLIQQMFKQTVNCVSAHPDLKHHPNLCETAYISQLADEKSYTLHTHPDDIDYPSPADKRTTKMLKKKNLCIILNNGRTRCWNEQDGFTNPTEEF